MINHLADTVVFCTAKVHCCFSFKKKIKFTTVHVEKKSELNEEIFVFKSNTKEL